jgi:hypothetical protein
MLVSATSRDGGQLHVRRTITIEPYEEASEPSAEAIDRGELVVCCDVPRPGHADELGSPVSIGGWCYASGGIDRVVAFLDGRSRHDLLFPVPRPDVEQDLGRPDALLSGFALPLDPNACPPGEHSLTLVAAATDGRRAGRAVSFGCRAAADQGTPERIASAGDRASPLRAAGGMIDSSMDLSELLERCEFESLRATVAERHAFVSLTESNIVSEAHETLLRSKLALQQELDAAQHALEEAQQRAAAAEYWLEEQRRSLSWRITQPLRAAMRAARRMRS